MKSIRLTVALVAAFAAYGFTPNIAEAQSRVDRNVVYGMYSGLALLMDVHYPDVPNGIGVIYVRGSGFHMPLDLDAPALKDGNRPHLPLSSLLAGGYTVFAINHRAAPRFRFPANVEDGQRAVRFVRHYSERFGIDPTRIGAVGTSSGGHLASMLGLMDGDPISNDPGIVDGESAKVQAVASSYAPYDLGAIVRNGLGVVPPIVSYVGALLDQGSLESELYKQASPLTYVSSDDPPVLLIHGDADVVVPFEQSEFLYEALTEIGVEARLIRIPGGGHGASIQTGSDMPDYLAATVEWFDENLLTQN